MRFVRAAISLTILLTLSPYAVDCSAIVTPAQMMQCCKTMPCAPHHGDAHDCCKTIPSGHSPFVPVFDKSVRPVPAAALLPDLILAPPALAYTRVGPTGASPPISPLAALTPLRI